MVVRIFFNPSVVYETSFVLFSDAILWNSKFILKLETQLSVINRTVFLYLGVIHLVRTQDVLKN